MGKLRVLIPQVFRRLRMVVKVAAAFLLVILWLWAVLAIRYSNLPFAFLRITLALVFGLMVPAAFVFLPRRQAVTGFLTAFFCVAVWWLLIPPSNDRDWSPDQEILPYAEIDGDSVTIRNIRNCAYRTTDDYVVRHYDKKFDLGRLESVWFILERFSAWEGAAHTFLSFGFGGDDYVAISVEIRKEKGETFSALKGLFKQYEIMYVVGDERDLIKLRLDFRRHPVHVYPIQVSKEKMRAVFLDMLERANRLRIRPEFYHTLASTCTTNILRHMNTIADRRVPFNLMVLFPGYSDRLAYDLDLIDTNVPFERVRQRFQVSPATDAIADGEEFSARIREARGTRQEQD